MLTLKDKYPFLSIIHGHIGNLLTYSKSSFEESIEELFLVQDFLYHFENIPEISLETKNSLSHLKDEVLSYFNINNFWGEPIFVFIDPKWKSICKNIIQPCLDKLEHDFSMNKINCLSYKQNFKPNLKPTDQEIVERAEYFYKLLIDNKIIKKQYLDY